MNPKARLPFAFFVVSFASLLSCQITFAAVHPNSSFPKPTVDETAVPRGTETAVLAGGCFWGVQAVFQHVRGVISVMSGYAGGSKDNAHYELVGSGETGHAESVQIVYDPARITYGQLLMIFFAVAHNPTELDKQGPDWGPQYRSAVFYGDETQQKIATAYIEQLNSARVYPQKIATKVVPLNGFYPAEGYHQDYLRLHPNNPYILINDVPKLNELKKQFPDLYREH